MPFGCPTALRPVQYTKAPASARARATPRPAPRVAPATVTRDAVNGSVACYDRRNRRGHGTDDTGRRARSNARLARGGEPPSEGADCLGPRDVLQHMVVHLALGLGIHGIERF
jgi:hypothetical protein